jgi:hypothetical protein
VILFELITRGACLIGMEKDVRSRLMQAPVTSSVQYPLNQLLEKSLRGIDVAAVLNKGGSSSSLLSLACHCCMLHDVRCLHKP